MTLRSRLTWFVLAAAAAAVPVLGGGCRSGDKSGEDKAPAQPLSSVASSTTPAPHEAMDPETFRATMRRGAQTEKTDRTQAATLYTETLARADLTNEQRATAQVRLGRLWLVDGKRDEARSLGHQALALRPGWNDAIALVKKADAQEADATASGGTAAPEKTARKKKDGDVATAKTKKREAKKAAADAATAEAMKAKEKEAAAGGKSSDGDAAASAAKKRDSETAAQLHQLTIERDLLKSRVKELELELVALKSSNEEKHAPDAPRK